jgi:hypothetical protein
MFFGTPHNGAEKANLLNLLLKVTFSQKGYVKDLAPNGQLLNDVNNTFGGTVSEGISRFVSYRETTGVPGIGVTSSMIFKLTVSR